MFTLLLKIPFNGVKIYSFFFFFFTKRVNGDYFQKYIYIKNKRFVLTE